MPTAKSGVSVPPVSNTRLRRTTEPVPCTITAM
jgi:hypothetical protein